MAKRKILGFTIGKDDEEKVPEQRLQAFSLPENQDAAVELQGPNVTGGAYGTYLDLEGTVKNEIELITRYREMAMNPEVEIAIDDIINEAVITEHGKSPVSISLGNIDIPEKVKEKIIEEFDEILRLLAFNEYAYDIFKKWYVDGRLYYHTMIDTKNPKEGIKELRAIDPRKIKKAREIKKPRMNGQRLESLPQNMTEYYIYYPGGISNRVGGMGGPNNQKGIKITRDSITHIHSGILDAGNKMILGNLHKAIKPMNQLKMLEDATVIYRISRAPERRIFYVDVGNLPKVKAEQYLSGIMSKFKNKLVYDTDTGDVRDDRKHMSMLEDYWLPRREGGRGTEITTLPGGTNLGEIEDIIYFKKKLYKALGVPVSRLEPEGSFSLGRATEITRDEVKFGKFVNRLRYRFTSLFDDLLEKQLTLKGIVSKEDWNVIKTLIEYRFREDSHFAELKGIEIMRERMEITQTIDEYVGKYYSKSWVRQNVLNQTEEEMRLMDKEMANEIDEGDVDPFEDETRQLDRQRAGVGPVPNNEPEPEQNQENVSTFKRVKAIRSRQTQLAEDIE
tara:strand:- start:11926 stop:13611 length:1686 start_codon:yes stop_codon:yes gene_type:complete